MEKENRFSILMKELNVTAYKLGKQLNLRPDIFYRIERGESKPSYDTLEEVIKLYPQINANWLIKGEGEMFLSSEPSQQTSENNKKGNLIQQKGIPYYPIEAFAGRTDFHFSDTPEFPTTKIYIPGFESCTAAISVAGDSMYPIYCSGDIIIIKEIQDLEIIIWGKAYVIITKDHRLIKYIHRHESSNFITLKSANQKYEPVDIKREKIIKLYSIVGVIKVEELTT